MSTFIWKFIRIFLDHIISSFKGLLKLYKIIQDNKFDKDTQNIMEEFQNEYLQNGWEVISSFAKNLIPWLLLFVLVFLNSNHSFYWRVLCSCPIVYILIIWIDKYYWSNKKIAEILLMIDIFLTGFLIIRSNLKSQSYVFNEHWMWFVIGTQYIGYFFFLKWRKVVIWFYIVIFAYILLLNLFYEVPIQLYSSMIIVWIIFPITLIFISQKIKEMIILLKTK